MIIFHKELWAFYKGGNMTNRFGHGALIHKGPARGFREAVIMHLMYFSDCFKIAAALRCRLHPPTVLSSIPLA